MEVTNLIWDTAFFNLNVYAVNIDSFDEVNVDLLRKQLQNLNVDVAYVIAKEGEQGLHKKLVEGGAVLYDQKITYTKRLTDNAVASSASVYSYHGNLTSDMVSLSIEAGDYSRFKLDPRFTGNFRRLYTDWISNSVTSLNADEVFVYDYEEKIVGLITCKIHNEIGTIGLIATDKTVRRQGIGMELIVAAENYFSENKILLLNVVTQAANEPACKFYERCGYKIKQVEYVYHWWLK